MNDDNLITDFQEKKSIDKAWINGGFFVFNKKIFKYLKENEDCILERKPLEELAKNKELIAYKHDNFWQCMDTKRDHEYLTGLIKNNEKREPWLND